MTCIACKTGSLVWVGIGQSEVQCPKCGVESPLTAQNQPSKASSRKPKKRATKKTTSRPSGKVPGGKALVPPPQMKRLKNLVDELQQLVRDNNAKSHVDVGLVKPSSVTLTSLVVFQTRIDAEIRNIQNRKDEIASNVRDLSDFLEDLNRTVSGEKLLTWGVRKLLEGVSGQGSTEKQIQLAKELQTNLRSQSFELTRQLDRLKVIQKHLKTLMGCPAAIKWKSVPETKLLNLPKELNPSSLKIVSTGQDNKKSISATSSERRKSRLEGMSRPQLLEALYPDIAHELSLHHARMNVPLSARVQSTELVWLVGQLWLVFLDGETIDWTDDEGLYEFVASMARRAPICSLAEEASILMHAQATYMSDAELRLALSIAVKKVGTVLVLNGNFDDTLYALISYRNRSRATSGSSFGDLG